MILRSVINFALFQGVWFMALLFEDNALLPIGIIIGVMFYFSKQIKQDILIVLLGLAISLSFEFLMVQLGWIAFKVYPYPIWFILLWSALLLTINTSMGFLTKLPWFVSVLICTVFAPASYWGGARFDVISIMSPVWHFWLSYGLAWALMFNIILIINKNIANKWYQSDRSDT